MYTTSERSRILAQIEAVYAMEGCCDTLNDLLVLHDRIAQAEHDSHIAAQLASLSAWEVMGAAPAVVEDTIIVLDEGDLEILEDNGPLLTPEEAEALDWADFDDQSPTLTYIRNTEAPPPCEEV